MAEAVEPLEFRDDQVSYIEFVEIFINLFLKLVKKDKFLGAETL
jgi:hypothetical protein